VVNTPYGSEWQPDERKQIDEFEKEIKPCQDLSCITGAVQSIFPMDEYLLFIKKEKLPDFQDNNQETLPLWKNGKVFIVKASGT
jgi:hypothetical protein